MSELVIDDSTRAEIEQLLKAGKSKAYLMRLGYSPRHVAQVDASMSMAIALVSVRTTRCRGCGQLVTLVTRSDRRKCFACAISQIKDPS